MDERDTSFPTTAWWLIVVLVAGWMFMNIARIGFSAETNAPKLLGVIILLIMSIPLCVPPLMLGFWGRRNSRGWPGIVGIIWFVVGVGVIWFVYGSV